MVIGMIVFIPTGSAQVLKRSICGKVALNTTEAVDRTEVLLYFEGAHLIPGATAQPDGTFCIDNYVGDLSQSTPAQLYVTSFCRPDDVTLVDVPFWSPLRKIPRFSGKRITIGPGKRHERRFGRCSDCLRAPNLDDSQPPALAIIDRDE